MAQFRDVLQKEVDLWSLAYGCVIYEVATLKPLMRTTDGRQGGAGPVVSGWCDLWRRSLNVTGLGQR